MAPNARRDSVGEEKETKMSALSVVQTFYALLAKGDVPGALGLLDPDIQWTEAERTPYFSGTMNGVNAVVSGFFVPLDRDFENFVTAPTNS
jgi:ketosteroid isomerase-like protein